MAAGNLFRRLANLPATAVVQLHGLPMTFSPVGGTPQTRTNGGRILKAPLDWVPMEVRNGAQEATSTTTPAVDLRISDLQRAPRQGDGVTIDGKTYLIGDVEPTGFDVCRCYLVQ